MSCGTEFVSLTKKFGKGEHWRSIWFTYMSLGPMDHISDLLNAMFLVKSLKSGETVPMRRDRRDYRHILKDSTDYVVITVRNSDMP